MKVDEEKLQKQIEKAKFDSFSAAVTYTIKYNQQLIEEHMKKYKDEEHSSNMSSFVKWLYNNGDCIYTYELFDNNIMLKEFSLNITN